jgi:hypothetical protein
MITKLLPFLCINNPGKNEELNLCLKMPRDDKKASLPKGKLLFSIVGVKSEF